MSTSNSELTRRASRTREAQCHFSNVKICPFFRSFRRRGRSQGRQRMSSVMFHIIVNLFASNSASRFYLDLYYSIRCDINVTQPFINHHYRIIVQIRCDTMATFVRTLIKYVERMLQCPVPKRLYYVYCSK